MVFKLSGIALLAALSCGVLTQGADAASLNAPLRLDGASPKGPLIGDSSGALYGTTQTGGGSEWGTVFKLTPNGSGYRESVLYQFKGKPDGGDPMAGLLGNNAGALFGTTWVGGTADRGSVFKLTPNGTGYSEKVLYSFQGGSDGGSPQCTLIEDAHGGLYGTASGGGDIGQGVVFKLTRNGNAYLESVLYSFQGGADGAGPSSLLADSSGALYATTSGGGAFGKGIVFKLTPNGNQYSESILFNFDGRSGGGEPSASLSADAAGALYGTAVNGGDPFCAQAGCGSVFKLSPSGGGYNASVLHTFGGGSDGKWPFAAVIVDSSGSVYGTTRGGDAVPGTVFKLTPNGNDYSYHVIHRFTGRDFPYAAVIEDGLGALYGTTVYGGTYGIGSVYKLTPHGVKYGERILHSFHP
ncbi:MAG TPA: choice-of-anchor tandem repeat GloVer-containing protein [Candidatus Eremiobacteraceae bacterium]